MVITTASKADEIDPRLYSRMQDQGLCTTVVIPVPAYSNKG
jgi:hypothetical protein